MTPAEFKELRLKLDYTQKKLAALLGVDLVTISRWECSSAPISKMAELSIRFLKIQKEINDTDF